MFHTSRGVEGTPRPVPVLWPLQHWAAAPPEPHPFSSQQLGWALSRLIHLRELVPAKCTCYHTALRGVSMQLS